MRTFVLLMLMGFLTECGSSSVSLSSASTSATAQYVNFTLSGYTASLQVYGTASDANSITAAISGVDTNILTLSNLGPSIVLLNITVQQELNANPGTSFSIVYPEPTGQQTLATSAFPLWSRYQATGSITTATSTSLSNSSGTMTAQITGLTANTAFFFKLIF